VYVLIFKVIQLCNRNMARRLMVYPLRTMKRFPLAFGSTEKTGTGFLKQALFVT
jgi:hypothetical protein